MLHQTDLLLETRTKICLIQNSAMALEHDERQATSKLKSGPNVEVCSTSPCQPAEENLKIVTCSTSKNHALSTENDVFNGENVSETGSGISLCFPVDAEHCIRDIPIAEGVPSEDKQPVISGCTMVTEELKNFKIFVPHKSPCYNNSLETITDQLKTVIVKDEECNPEGQGPSVVDVKALTEGGLHRLKGDDKGMLKEAFILRSSIVENKHVCISHEWEQNSKQINVGCMLPECINESAILSSDRTENPSEARAEDGEKDRESAIISSDQNKNIFEVPAGNGERESGLKSSTCCSINSLDVRLESLSGRTENLSEVRAEDGEKDRESAIISSDQNENIFEVLAGNGETQSGFMSSTCCSINCLDVRVESLSGRTEDPSEVRAEDGEKDRESAIISSNQNENIFDVPAGNGEREGGPKSSIHHSINCLDVRLESLSGMTKNLSEVRAEDGEKDKVSTIISSDQDENIFEVPAASAEKGIRIKSSTYCSINCLDVRLESVSRRTDLSVESSVERVITKPSSTMTFLSDSSDGGVSLCCGPAADSNGITSCDNHLGESSEVASHNNDGVEICEVKGQSKKGGTEFPNSRLLERDTNEKTQLDLINNFPLQMSPFSALDMDQTLAPEGLSIESTGSTDASKISPVQPNASFARKHLIREGCLGEDTRSLEPKDVDERMPESLHSPELDWQGPARQREVLAKHKSTFDGQNSLDMSHLRKDSDGACDLNERLLTNSVVMNSVTSEKSLRSNISATGLVDCDATKNAERQGQRSVVTSGFADNTVFQRNNGETVVDATHKSALNGQNSPVSSHSRKDSNGTSESTEKLLTDALALNCAASQRAEAINIFSPAMAESNVTRNVQSQKSAGLSVSQIGSYVPSSYSGQNLHESSCDVSGESSGNNDAAELSNYTYSGLIPLSGPVSYAEPISHSGHVPFSGSISLRSDSSTTSTRSFAFPILASEWNSSPVKMVQPDSRYIKKKRRWRFFSCCRKPSV